MHFLRPIRINYLVGNTGDPVSSGFMTSSLGSMSSRWQIDFNPFAGSGLWFDFCLIDGFQSSEPSNRLQPNWNGRAGPGTAGDVCKEVSLPEGRRKPAS